MSPGGNAETWCSKLGPRLPIDKTGKHEDLKASARVSQCHQRCWACLAQGGSLWQPGPCPEPSPAPAARPHGVTKERCVFGFGFSQLRAVKVPVLPALGFVRLFSWDLSSGCPSADRFQPALQKVGLSVRGPAPPSFAAASHTQQPGRTAPATAPNAPRPVRVCF